MAGWAKRSFEQSANTHRSITARKLALAISTADPFYKLRAIKAF
jgi:hypothetical protein